MTQPDINLIGSLTRVRKSTTSYRVPSVRFLTYVFFIDRVKVNFDLYGIEYHAVERCCSAAEALDREWSTERAVFVVWALGALDHALEPAFHRVYPRHDVQLVLSQNVADNDCVDFVT
ncbi:jg1255 [Pararge aegeria aegeria]|uniref:Jg1255 protein n=1 Tax=Pararge aegeria aegeria TaxID=348720 RepID=A0A8S4QXU4_9NEOP|nr:jg1255 [Pararge aegeria aegeria]